MPPEIGTCRGRRDHAPQRRRRLPTHPPRRHNAAEVATRRLEENTCRTHVPLVSGSTHQILSDIDLRPAGNHEQMKALPPRTSRRSADAYRRSERRQLDGAMARRDHALRSTLRDGVPVRSGEEQSGRQTDQAGEVVDQVSTLDLESRDWGHHAPSSGPDGNPLSSRIRNGTLAVGRNAGSDGSDAIITPSRSRETLPIPARPRTPPRYSAPSRIAHAWTISQT